MNWKFWEKSAPPPQETKSHDYFNVFEYLTRTGWGRVTAWQALRYYEQIAPVATGVDKVVDKFKALQLSIYDTATKQYEPNHPLVTFLKTPNASQSGTDFFKAFGTYYEVTGEVYLVATGNPNRPPLELIIVQPQFVSIVMGRDGLPDKYVVSSGSNQTPTTFIRKEDSTGLRYFNGADREIWHVKDFNPNASSSNFHGASVLNAVYYEIEQHLYSSRHNLSLLQKGGRITGAMVAENVLSPEAFDRLKREIDIVMRGADNAGAIPLFDGGAKFEEMGTSNRDMDFLKLKQDVSQSIFIRLKIPLALVVPSKQTLDNYATALLALYDDAVIPLSRKLYGELDLFIGERFKLKETEELSVDPVTIPALEPRRLDNLTKVNKLYLTSDNEQRGQLGREDRPGGDAIYKPANLVPVGEDADTTGNRDKPATRKEFIAIVREQKDKDGNRLYTDKQIEEFADEEGLIETKEGESTEHYITKCSECKAVINQCRCGSHDKVITWKICDTCKARSK
ncbi:phage portal protein [Candidatus Pacearchaeota archaeon]|nr:phage portal protein [Candidatus Pacearchaeota archaeon]